MQNQPQKKPTKYAEPDSLAFRAHYVQKRRKKRKQQEPE
jgi:hypothetical protein